MQLMPNFLPLLYIKFYIAQNPRLSKHKYIPFYTQFCPSPRSKLPSVSVEMLAGCLSLFRKQGTKAFVARVQRPSWRARRASSRDTWAREPPPATRQRGDGRFGFRKAPRGPKYEFCGNAASDYRSVGVNVFWETVWILNAGWSGGRRMYWH